MAIASRRARRRSAAAPHLARTITHLRVAGADVSADALGALAGFRALERLDITNVVSSGYANDECFDYDDPFGKNKTCAYDGALEAVLAAAPRLEQLDLGYGSDDMTRYFWDYCVSSGAIDRFQRAYPSVRFTMASDLDPIPYPFPGGDAEENGAVFTALKELAQDEEDEGVRENAKLAARREDRRRRRGRRRRRRRRRRRHMYDDDDDGES